RRTDQEQFQTVRKNEPANLSRARAKCQSNADFTDAFKRRVSEKPVEAEGGEYKSESTEDGEKKAEQPLASPRFAHAVGHQALIEQRQRGIDPGCGVVNRPLERGGGHCRSYEQREARSLSLP